MTDQDRRPPDYRGHDPVITRPLPGGVIAICNARCVLCSVPWPCPSAIHIARHTATAATSDTTDDVRSST